MQGSAASHSVSTRLADSNAVPWVKLTHMRPRLCRAFGMLMSDKAKPLIGGAMALVVIFLLGMWNDSVVKRNGGRYDAGGIWRPYHWR